MVAPVALTLLALTALAVAPSIVANPAVFDNDGDVSYYGVNPVLENIDIEQSNSYGVSILHMEDDEPYVMTSSYCVIDFDVNGSFDSVELDFDAAYRYCVVINSDLEDVGALSVEVDLPPLAYWFFDESENLYRLNVCKSHVEAVPSGVYYGVLDDDGLVLQAPTYVLNGNNGIIDGITDGLGVIGNLGNALVDGFDGVFMSNTTLSTIGSFTFILFGLGISVGIVKKCFSWVTGRHGV